MKAAALRLASSSDYPAKQEADIVFEMGRQMGALIAAHTRAEKAAFAAEKAGRNESAIAVRADNIQERLDLLADAVPAHCATTVAGAIVSLIRASGLASVAESSNYEDQEWRRKRDFASIKACLYSALHVLRDAAPDVYEQCGGEYYMPLFRSPFECIADADKWIERDAAEARGETVAAA